MKALGCAWQEVANLSTSTRRDRGVDTDVLRLQRNLQFLYEEHLARIEARSLGCDGWIRHDDNPWLVDVRVNGTKEDVIGRSAYIGELNHRTTVYAELIKPNYQGGEFNRTRSVNQYLTHWIYPYRGKYHPQMIRALLNIVNARPSSLVLDPYVGSGTTALEASLLGIDCIGIDISPLCVLLTNVKTQSSQAVQDIQEYVAELINSHALDPHDTSVLPSGNDVVRDFVQVARMTTLSDVARRKRDGRVWFRRNLEFMLKSVEAHTRALSAFNIDPGKVTAVRGDARDLCTAGVEEESVDAVITSPPYSIALDYLKNDDHALRALDADLESLRSEMTGVRGRGAKSKLKLYNEDMQRMFCEVARVLKPGARAVFVIGDATVDRQEYTTTRVMGDWAIEAGLEREREIQKIVFGLYNVMNDEKILIFRKPK